MNGRYTLEDVRATYKKRDAWWTVLLVDPIAGRLTVPIANRTSLTPNQLTIGAGILGVGAAAAFAEGSRAALLTGAALFYLSFVVDCIDGKIARLKHNGTVFGTWLDYVLDRVKVAACAVALMAGQYVRTDRAIYLYLAMVVLIMEMIRYLDLARVRDTRRMMTSRIRAAVRRIVAADGQATGDGRTPVGVPDTDLEDKGAAVATAELSTVEGADADAYVDESAADDPLARYRDPATALHENFRRRFGFYERFRAFLLRHRIRTHLWSGIEFEMFVFIVGPATGAIIEVTIASAALLVLFESAVIYKLWLSTKDYARIMEELEELVPPTDDPVQSTNQSVGSHPARRGVHDVGPGSLPSQSRLSGAVRDPASRPHSAVPPALVA